MKMAGKVLTFFFLLSIITLGICKPRLSSFPKLFGREMAFANHKREANSCGGGGICLTLSVCTPGSTDEEGEFIPVEGSCPSSNLVCCVYVPFNEKR